MIKIDIWNYRIVMFIITQGFSTGTGSKHSVCQMKNMYITGINIVIF